MAGRDADVLLVGGGVARPRPAPTQLREDGFGGSILLVGREPDPPYNRPPVSKGYLSGDEDRDERARPSRRPGTRRRASSC